MPNLSFDVVTYILNHLDPPDDVDTLRSLSLCCSDFRPLSQRRLFHTVNLKHYRRTREEFDKIARLLAVLNSRPRIADYVRSFTFCLLPEDLDLVWGPFSTATMLSMILPMLHQVKSVEWVSFSLGVLDWEKFCASDANQELSQAILGVLPSLTSMHLSGTVLRQFPFHLMAGRNVLFDATEDAWGLLLTVVPDDNPMGSDNHNHTPCLRIRNYDISDGDWPDSLSEESEGPFPRFLDLPFDFSHLQGLRVKWRVQDGLRPVIGTEKIMSCASMLKELTCIVPAVFTCTSTFGGLARIIQSHASPSLTTLHVQVEAKHSYFDEPLHTLCRELSDPGGYYHLERLSVTLDHPEYSSFGKYEVQDLDGAICRGIFPALKVVDVSINLSTTPKWLLYEDSKNATRPEWLKYGNSDEERAIIPERLRFDTQEKMNSMDELATYLGEVYTWYFQGLRSRADLIFSCKVLLLNLSQGLVDSPFESEW
ncbi:hypothetical protein M413DRAFT_444314 [Hebeloma cylindrosporum]|uniref:F-box domain-containing protein n=1 Tax=Hebeloma cylindrosporum TaxID=76867 RepID=A0A0C2XYC8_HEBCY|nr:hypothetical protein M413DRAFT_444314 [Hebeloma cylindrosporum h7]